MQERSVILVPHDPEWARLFEIERDRLVNVLGDLCSAIHHIGSTAIPDIPAKPIIDILVEVSSILRVDELNSAMIAIGYEPLGEYGIPGRRFFRKQANDPGSFHVHVFQNGDSEIARHLKFRDCLIAHPEEAQAYSSLKDQLAKQFAEDRNSYTDAKEDFIRRIGRRAEEEPAGSKAARRPAH